MATNIIIVTTNYGFTGLGVITLVEVYSGINGKLDDWKELIERFGNMTGYVG